MELNDKLYRAFLEEMNALESFRMEYAAEHPDAPLEREDPDVRRLMEALAFFSARTHLAALRNVVAQRRRVFRQFFPYLLDPLPAMGMLQAAPNGKLSDTVTLPRNAEIAVSDGTRTALFRTLRELRILPLSLGRLTPLVRPDGGLRFLLPASVPYPRNGAVGSLDFFIDYLNDHLGSLRVMDALKHHLTQASVSFEARVDETTRGNPCRVSFGLSEDSFEGTAPLQRERTHFHFPKAELFLALELPEPPRNWQRFTLIFDVDGGWPKGLRLTREVFQLFVTPIENLQRLPAQPVIHDGTKEAWPIRHPDGSGGFELRSVLGVYKTVDGALVPLRPTVLTGGTGTYELGEESRGDGRTVPLLMPHLPEAFETPVTLSVEAEWLQRWFSQRIGQRLSAEPYRHGFQGVQWDVLGGIVPHRDAEIENGADDFTQVLVLQNRRRLGREELVALLHLLGAWSGPYAAVRDGWTDVTTREVPTQTENGSGTKLVYELGFREVAANLRPLVTSFLAHLERVLDAWIPDLPVEVRLAERT